MNQELTDFIRQKSALGTVDWEDRKQKYLVAVEELYHNVEGFLNDAIQQKTVSVVRSSTRLVELSIGIYLIDELILNIGMQQVRFLPQGRNIAGAEGRVDMRGDHGTALLIHEDGEWFLVAAKLPQVIKEKFDETAFTNALKLVMGA